MSVDPSVTPAGPSGPPSSVPGTDTHRDRERLEGLVEGVWEQQLESGCVWYSARYKALLGFGDHELPNQVDAVRERIHADDLDALRAAEAASLPGGSVREAQLRIRCRDGAFRWFRKRFRIWPAEPDRAGRLLGTLDDVHEQVLATEALKAQHAVLEERVRERTQGLEAALAMAESQRVAAEQANQAKASFLTHMSHELRTPLNGMLGMTRLARSLARGAEQQRYLELAQQAGENLLQILDEVLDFTRGDAGRLLLREDSLDLAELACECLRSFMPSVRRKGLQVGFDWLGDRTRVRADAGRLRQMIGNLLGNAVKYTDAGRILLLVAIDAPVAGRCPVRIRVRDTGIGLDPATAARIFEPFEQGDDRMARRHGGAGLGLSVVRTLARLMGGEVSVRSRPGRGSEFRVDITLAADPSETPLPGNPVARGHVWVIVQDTVHGPGIARRLDRLGWSAEAIPSLKTAIARFATGVRAPEGVLIGEDALGHATDFAALRSRLGPAVPITVLLRPDFDLGTIHAATEQWQVRIAILPLSPADLRAAVEPRSRNGSGAPFAPPPQPQPQAQATTDERPKAHVLVVEDNPLNQIIAREMVSALGLRPAVVSSGEEAVIRCREAPPDLVLMDIQMPGMDGHETTRRLRAMQSRGELRHFPIIALTAHAMASDRQASLAAGLDEHLTKPVQMEQLRRVLGEWLRDG